MATNQAQKKSSGEDRDYFDIRNARTVNQPANDNYPREANFVPERRSPPPKADKADNDNNQGPELSKVAVQYSKSYKRGRSLPGGKSTQMPTRTIPANLNTLKKASAVPILISAGTTPYMFQLIFALIGLVGLVSMGAVDSASLLSAIDTVAFGAGTNIAGGVWLIGTLGSLISGLFIVAFTAKLLSSAGGHPASGGSIFMLAFCVALHLAPIVNLFPIMAIWCAFVLFAK